MTTNDPLIYIIIINWNGYVHTVECIKSIKKNEYKNYRIVVIDNNSKDNQANKLAQKFPEIKLIKNEKNIGFTGANNQGIDYALENNAEFIFILNNDAIIHPDTISKLVDYVLKIDFNGILQPKILYYNAEDIWSMGGNINRLTTIPKMIGQGSPGNKYDQIICPDYAVGCAMFISREVFEKIRKFDNDYFAYYEDVDFSYRAKRKGFDIKVIPESIIEHKVSQSSNIDEKDKLDPNQAYLYAKNGLLFGFKNFSDFEQLWYVISQLFIKTPAYVLFKCSGIQARRQYIKGVINGLNL